MSAPFDPDQVRTTDPDPVGRRRTPRPSGAPTAAGAPSAGFASGPTAPSTDIAAGRDSLVHGGALLADKYRLERSLGEGGMGRVWLATHIDLGRHVAIKILHRDRHADASMRERFRREARAATGLRHPGIVQGLDYGMLEDGRHFLVMEYVEGRTLSHVLKKRGALPWETALRIAREIAEALAYAHDEGIIHRDLKPANILLEGADVPLERASVRILDFGIARDQTLAMGNTLTKQGMVLGTPIYAPPEQLRGDRVSTAADVFSLGVVLFRMLTARVPFEGKSFQDVAVAQDAGPAPRLNEFLPDAMRPPALDALVRRLLARHAADRPPDGRAVVAELESLLGPGAGQRGVRLPRSSVLVIGVVLVLLGMGVGVGLAVWLLG